MPARPALPAPPHARPTPRRAELLAVVAFWTLLGALTLVRRLLDPRGPGIATPGVVFVLVEYGMWALATPLVFGLARRLPLERGALGRRLALHLAVALGVAAVFEVVRVGVLRPLLVPDGLYGPRPGRGPFTPAEALLRVQFLDELVIYLAVLAAGFARDYFLRYRAHAAEAARLQAQLAEARLAALRMQLNPHFLFNTLHAVSALVERDPAGVRRIVARLSALLRHVLDSGARQEVPLADELAFLHDYLDIQRVRFQGRLEVTDDVDPAALDALVPNLLLQPLVENAVEHGVGRREDGTGRIGLSARRDGSRLVLAVRDNGPGLDAWGMPGGDGAARGVGLANTRARLAELYGDTATLTLRPAEGGGLVAEVVLPYHTAADLRAAAPALADA